MVDPLTTGFVAGYKLLEDLKVLERFVKPGVPLEDSRVAKKILDDVIALTKSLANSIPELKEVNQDLQRLEFSETPVEDLDLIRIKLQDNVKRIQVRNL